MRAAEPEEATARGDPRVVALFADLEPRLRQALFAYAGPADVDDAVGEAFLVLCSRPDEVLAMANPRGYLYRVARDKVRGARRLAPELPPVRPALQPEVVPELMPALRALSPHQRTAVFLAAGLGWTWPEIGEFLGTSASTVRNHYRRGMAKLRREIGGVSG